jgi:2-succinyl-5-enolpyruvyl-6-hydroxy-3-cyclohexene-1-carboxylate synthase
VTVPNAATALARTVVDELVRGGVAHVVLCPGSRSAALAFAAHDAATSGRLALHARIDERTAGFLALGLARTGRRPVAVVTTSGTAVANLHPAVLEGCHAGVPLVLLTADRPASLRGTGANQTTDQVKLFGDAVRAFADVPPAVPGHREDEQVRAWRALVSRSLLTAAGDGGTARGPVHLNLQFDGPLTPDVADGWSASPDGRPDGAPWTSRTGVPAAEPVDLTDDRRTVVMAGDDAGPPARVLAEQGGWPLLAEPTSGSRTGANAVRTYRLLLADRGLAGRIERVVVAGHPTLSRPVTRLLSRPDVEVVALVPPGSPTRAWTDPGHTVARVVRSATASATGGEWLDEWRDRDADVAARLDALLAARSRLSGHLVASAVARTLPADGLLVVGASNPIRDLDLMVPRYPVGEHRLVVANRGLAGIDGTVSTAVGAALGRPRTSRALALVGDVTFIHDMTGLVLGPEEQRPDLTVVVVNDDGGSIFSVLEQGAPAHAGAFERVFATPHGVDLAALCSATGTPFARVEDLDSLDAAVAAPARGLTVVEAVVRRDDRRQLDAEIRALV